MPIDELINPKVFISYSWSNQLHEEWVLNLAIGLVDSGVEVILDKWDLKEGHDSIAFMEQMVVDSTIDKVLIVSDKLYAEKADGRSGGVGTETQIISREVYNSQKQDKFVAVIAERNDDGTACLPTYYKSRIYIDLSDPDKYSENFDVLLRCIYNKPLYVKPTLGKRPAFLDEVEHISLGTTSSFRRVLSAIKENKPFAFGALTEYLTTFSTNLEKFRIKNTDGEFDDVVISNIEKFIPYRNEISSLVLTISQYAPTNENIFALHKFFESVISYMQRPEYIDRYYDTDFDNFKFIIHELFLYTIAILIKSEKFEQVRILLENEYYLEGRSDYGRNAMVNYTIFSQYIKSLTNRNDRLGLGKLSLMANLIKDRSKTSIINFESLMQADFVLFIRSEIENNEYMTWFPDTLLYVDHFHGPFEIFARSASKEYFNKVKLLINVSHPSDIKSLLDSYKTRERELPRWQFESFSPFQLLGYDQLATKS